MVILELQQMQSARANVCDKTARAYARHQEREGIVGRRGSRSLPGKEKTAQRQTKRNGEYNIILTKVQCGMVFEQYLVEEKI